MLNILKNKNVWHSDSEQN